MIKESKNIELKVKELYKNKEMLVFRIAKYALSHVLILKAK